MLYAVDDLPDRRQTPRLSWEDLGLSPFLEFLNDAILVIDRGTRTISLWNRTAEIVLGYTKPEATGMPVDSFMPERYRGNQPALVKRYNPEMAENDLADVTRPVELPVLHRDGRELLVESTYTPVDTREAEAGGHDHVLVLVRDVTDKQGLRIIAEQMISAISRRPDISLDPKLIETPPTHDTNPSYRAVPHLGEREREILALIASGHTHPQIARSLHIATSTVKSHLTRIKNKLGAENGPHAACLAVQMNLIGPSAPVYTR